MKFPRKRQLNVVILLSMLIKSTLNMKIQWMISRGANLTDPFDLVFDLIKISVT